MAEYIDRNYIVKAYIDLCKALSQKSKICPGADEPTVKNVFAIVMHAPAADVAEVRHGTWLEYDGADKGFHYCSECKRQAFNYEDGEVVVEILSDWCPHCGARMGKEGEHGS